MVPERHRLRRLEMGEAGHDGARVLPREPDKHGLEPGEVPVRPVDCVAHPEPEVGRHLVVARPRGVQPPRGLADQLLEPRLYVHVDVLERLREGEVPGLDL